MFSFRAMGTDVVVATPSLERHDEARVGDAVAALFADVERRFSRFRPDSELSRLNAATGPVVVSAWMLELLVSARAWWVRTGGLFDPATGGALVALGYDATFDEVARRAPAQGGATAPHASLLDVVIDERSRTIVKPAHVRLDFGGFLKGRTVDEAAALLPGAGVVDAGGDAALRGAGAGPGWVVDVEDPRDADRTLLSFCARDQAVATSATNRRRWHAGGALQHHLVDPRTGAASLSDLAQATVVADSAEAADVLAKCAFLLGADEGTQLLEDEGVAGVLVGVDGSVTVVGDLEVCDA